MIRRWERGVHWNNRWKLAHHRRRAVLGVPHGRYELPVRKNSPSKKLHTGEDLLKVRRYNRFYGIARFYEALNTVWEVSCRCRSAYECWNTSTTRFVTGFPGWRRNAWDTATGGIKLWMMFTGSCDLLTRYLEWTTRISRNPNPFEEELFETFSTDFYGPNQSFSNRRSRFVFICVDHLINWTIIMITHNTISEEVVNVFEKEVI